jgi:uncharacterized membrane protein YhhN
MHSISPIWLMTGAVAVLALLVFERLEARFAAATAKLTASTCFVGLALSLDALSTQTGQLFFGGLLLCWLGDALLLSRGTSMAFQLGIGSFLLGHVAYAAAFYRWGIDGLGFTLAAIAIALLGLPTLHWLRPHVPAEFKIPVMSYVIVIGFMVACAVGAAQQSAPALAAAGALLFAASDLSVARERFVSPGFINSLWGLPAYYAAQIAIVLSLQAL